MDNLHLMTQEDLPAVLAALAASGSTARTGESWRQDHMTALVLRDKNQITAVMPMSRRTLPLGPGRDIKVGWLSSNQFASRMSLRRQTRSSAGEWARLLPELDALVVLRRDEASLAGRWYAQTGFHEVLSIRCLYLEMDAAPETVARGGVPGTGRYQVHVATASEMPPTAPGAWSTWQRQMFEVYRDVYRACGGAQLRSEGFWQPALTHHYYGAHYQFQIIGLWTGTPAAPGATLMGYAVVGWSGWHSKRPRMDILELATRQWDTAVASELIQTTCQLAWSKNVRQVRAVISAHDPYRGHLMRNGFVDRWGYLMLAKWLHAQRYLDALAGGLPSEAGGMELQLAVSGEVPLTLRCATPTTSRGGEGAGGVVIETGSVGSAPVAVGGAGGVLELQGDARTMTRLLLNRVDIPGAVADGTLFAAHKLSTGDVARLSLVFPWTPWVFHMLDYI